MTRGSATRLVLAARIAATAWVVPRLVRTALAQRRIEPLGPAELESGIVIAVVVPARDEAARLGPLLDALAGAPRVDRVLVVDDESDDDTAALALRHGADVVRGVERPDGWAGKTWALDQGVRCTTGEWIVFVDADVRPAPDLPARVVARALRDDLDLISVATVARLDPAARILHAAMLATLVYRFGGPGVSERGREVANGQCLAVRRSALDAVGGWGAVAGAVVEDVALARRFTADGRRVAFVDAGGDAVVEPGGWRDVLVGWGRSIGLPGVEPRARIALDAAAMTVTMPIALARVLVGRGDLLDVALLAVRLGIAAGTRRSYRPAGAVLWMAPLADVVAIGLAAGAVVRRHVTWRGRRLAIR